MNHPKTTKAKINTISRLHERCGQVKNEKINE